MKHCLILILSLAFTSTIAQSEFGIINDPDGFTNVRESGSSSSTIVYTIKDGEFFLFKSDSLRNWFEVQNFKGQIGFMHKSRILKTDSLTIAGRKCKSDDITVQISRRKLSDISIILTKVINENYYDGYNFGRAYHRYVDIYNPYGENSTLKFENIEALGGSYDVNVIDSLEPEYLVLLKHGDYHGETIIISKNGIVTNISGGSVSYYSSKYLLSLGECDVGFCSLSVFNLETGTVVYTLNDINDWYEFYNVNDSLIINVLDPTKKEDGLYLSYLDLDKLNLNPVINIERDKLKPLKIISK